MQSKLMDVSLNNPAAAWGERKHKDDFERFFFLCNKGRIIVQPSNNKGHAHRPELDQQDEGIKHSDEQVTIDRTFVLEIQECAQCLGLALGLGNSVQRLRISAHSTSKDSQTARPNDLGYLQNASFAHIRWYRRRSRSRGNTRSHKVDQIRHQSRHG